MSALAWYQQLLLGSYLGVVGLLGIYGLHRYILVYLYYKHRRAVPRLECCFAVLPRVTVQLPMYNERDVARRVIEHACAIDYPANRLQIQVIDDSTDDTTAIARATVDVMRQRGHDVVLLHRTDRVGYKAGALEAATPTATGEFIAIFDADFVPPVEILHDTVHYFTDPTVGMVQARWEHLNREQSLLTRTQAVMLDGHFVLEHGARSRGGRFMSFNGTAGLWRACCIMDAGGWHHDTLTEDLDLSYRAQLRGWRFLFLPWIAVPAELPPRMDAFKAQQFRWTKGGAQTCRKLLPTILSSPASWRVKLEAVFHLTSNIVYGLVLLMTVLIFPAVVVATTTLSWDHNPWWRGMIGLSILVLATLSAGTFYVTSQRELHRGWWDSVRGLPALLSLGVGIAANNARAMIEGFSGKQSPFVRTPKFGSGAGSYAAVRRLTLQPFIELSLGLYLSTCAVLSLFYAGAGISLPFLVLFAFGYMQVAIGTWRAMFADATAVAAETCSGEPGVARPGALRDRSAAVDAKPASRSAMSR